MNRYANLENNLFFGWLEQFYIMKMEDKIL